MRALSMAIFSVLISLSGFAYGSTSTYQLTCVGPIYPGGSIATHVFLYNMDAFVMHYSRTIAEEATSIMDCQYQFPGHLGSNYTDFKCGILPSAPYLILSIPTEVVSINGGDTSKKYSMIQTLIDDQQHPVEMNNCGLVKVGN